MLGRRATGCDEEHPNGQRLAQQFRTDTTVMLSLRMHETDPPSARADHRFHAAKKPEIPA